MIRQALRPRASSPGQSTLTLRLAMSEVEKSLQEVYSVPTSTSTSTSNGSHNPSAEALNGRERVESHSPFPRSPSFHFPPSKSTRKSKKDKHASKNKEEREREREKRRSKKIERNGQEDRGWKNSAGGYENQSSLLHLGLPPLDDSDCENSVVLCDDSGDEGMCVKYCVILMRTHCNLNISFALVLLFLFSSTAPTSFSPFIRNMLSSDCIITTEKNMHRKKLPIYCTSFVTCT